jgi:uncharacterized delta-60 repeat protein
MRIRPFGGILFSFLAALLLFFAVSTAPTTADPGPSDDTRVAPTRRGQQGAAPEAARFAIRPGRGLAGKLDRSFGELGFVEESSPVSYSRFARAVVVQPDGWILLAGGDIDGARIFRYDPDGNLDPAFGDSGSVSFGPEGPGIEGAVTAIALQPDGKIVVACERNGPDKWEWYRYVARFDSDGVLDGGFGTSGFSVLGIPGPNEGIADMALQPNGKIVVGGRRANPGWMFYLARLNEDGSPDPGFGTLGEVITGFPSGKRAWVVSVLIQPDDRIVAVGDTVGDVAIARYEPDGTLDAGIGLIVSDIIVGPKWGALQPDGSIVVAGSWRDIPMPYPDMAATRFLPDGTLDSGFGEGGRTRVDFNDHYDAVAAGAIQDDGGIILWGPTSYFHGAEQVAALGLTRLDREGRLDMRFGRGGTTVVGRRADPDHSDLALQPDGRILAAGTTFEGSGSSTLRTWLLARFHP